MSYIGYSQAANHVAPPHIREVLTPDGSATYFDLQNDVVGFEEANVIVVVNNVIQEPNASYTIINDAALRPRRLDFAGVALAATDSLYVIHQGTGTLYNTPATGSVTKASMAANMVSHVVDKFLGSAATTAGSNANSELQLSEIPSTADSVSVYVNGVYQRSATNYNITVGTNNLIFTSSLATTDQIDIHHHTFRSTTTKVAEGSVGTAQLADNAITAAKIADGTVIAQDIAANAVGASELADNAVDTAAIANDAVTSAKIGTGQVIADGIGAGAVVTAGLGANAVTTAKMASSVIGVKPHIQPGTLHPAVAGKLLDGSTSHGSTYGVAQADGRMYYYTDIKGSKPIKDPRIGSHFGSQRHKFRSLQLLEQETATHGKNINSVDGREWCRTVDGTSAWLITNDANGHGIYATSSCTSNFLEITGYFNDINFFIGTNNSNRCDDIDISVNGTLSVDGSATLGGRTSVDSPLYGRYVDPSAIYNGGSTLSSSLGTTPKINTIRYEAKTGSSEYIYLFGIELIAQDTTDTASKSKIQIPSQNVVSYGKKFTVAAAAHHYDPFNVFTNSTTLHSAVVDTATSLGLSTGTLHGATWAISGSNNIRPYNGGRVVKWVDSSGVIKTSVNMMPPNAQNIAGSVAGTTEVTTPSATNTTYTPIFSDDAIENSLSEVAKSFHWREFGNGAANGGTGSSAYPDFSMLANAEDDVAYVMDDGLTSMAGDDNSSHTNSIDWYTGGGDVVYITWIGTGISFEATPDAVHAGITNGVYAQNLPYGTHILKLQRSSPYDVWIDGVQLSSAATSSSDHIGSKFISFHQPKMPPIPEDAVVISDYMLMADHVNKTSHTSGTTIAKGVRLLDCSRDVFHDTASGSMLLNNLSIDAGYPFRNYMNAGSGAKNSKIPTFATSFGIDQLAAVRNDTHVAGSAVAHTDVGTHTHINTPLALGLNIFAAQAASGQDGGFYRFEIASPIHTSSHYQTFETPFLHELVGGDRNMEQTNLVVTPDGKTWDEVTRDVGYIGKGVVSTSGAPTSTGVGGNIFDEWRGTLHTHRNCYNKDFAIAYDRIICLVSGEYNIEAQTLSKGAMMHCAVYINGSAAIQPYGQTTSHDTPTVSLNVSLKRGDYIQSKGGWYGSTLHDHYQITRI
jgi:hypothetical protein